MRLPAVLTKLGTESSNSSQRDTTADGTGEESKVIDENE
jgi:hypothetical protein